MTHLQSPKAEASYAPSTPSPLRQAHFSPELIQIRTLPWHTDVENQIGPEASPAPDCENWQVFALRWFKYFLWFLVIGSIITIVVIYALHERK
jgi:hypothetical protein